MLRDRLGILAPGVRANKKNGLISVAFQYSMITDIFLSFKKDPTVKRHLVKAISWRLVGTVDTVMLGFLITGRLSTGIQIGGLELVTKMILYFLHERAWHRIAFGLPGNVKRVVFFRRTNGQLFRESFSVTKKERERLNAHPAFTIWFTGLSGSGKSTLASALDEWFHARKIRAYVIDGDNTRMGINSDLDFSREGRQENIRRVAEICRLFNEAGMIVISSFISPFRQDREQAEAIIGSGNFMEVFIDASLEKCMARDRKGLYKLAAEGKISDFTGISSPYEKPERPEVRVETDNATVAESVQTLISYLEANKLR
jgi:adenylyl-sulfate kinase